MQARKDPMLTNEQRNLIYEIATADSLQDSFSIFSCFQDKLENCKFIFASTKGADPGLSVNFDFKGGSAIRSLFNSDKVLVLDKETLHEMTRGKATFQVDYSISLDTQALSYLEPYAKNNTSKLPNDFKDIFECIARDDVFVDPMPYIHENYSNLSDYKSVEAVFNKIKAYEVLRTIDKSALRNESIVKSCRTESELLKLAQEQVARMFSDLSVPGFIKQISASFNYQYACLLKMIVIQLANPKRAAYKKLFEYLDFCHKEVSVIGLRELVIASEFFERGQDFLFFGKVQKNKKDILKIIKGMAWDLYHVRQLEKMVTIRPNNSARYYFPSLLTCDKRLVEVIGLYPLKCCAYVEGDYEPMPFFDGDILGALSDSEVEKNGILESYFSLEKQNERSYARGFVADNLPSLVKQLEVELKCVSNING